MMELATDRILEELRGSLNPRSHRRGLGSEPLPPAATGARQDAMLANHKTPRDQRRCQCGKCRNCVENARWERVFNQKFADPDYYKVLATRGGSSLSSL